MEASGDDLAFLISGTCRGARPTCRAPSACHRARSGQPDAAPLGAWASALRLTVWCMLDL